MGGMEIFENVLLEYFRQYSHYFYRVDVTLNIIKQATISIASEAPNVT
jgi:ABC-type long-subunit fatty acid transport system fused permease/ATPase subunit